MKILFAMQQYIQSNCLSEYTSDYYNFYLGSKSVVKDSRVFDYFTHTLKFGKDEMNKQLLSEVDKYKPDVVFIVLRDDEIYTETVDKISSKAVCLGFFHDDKWREDYVKMWAKHFTYVLCTDPDGEKRFAAMGVLNALSFPQSCNPDAYNSKVDVRDIDVSFVGAYHPHRAWLIERIRKIGVDVQVYGPGWHRNNIMSAVFGKMLKVINKISDGRCEDNKDNILTFNKMTEIFSRSKINLNLSNSTNWDARYLTSSPLSLWNSLRSNKYRDGIKLRCFEICASGGFELTYYEEGLERYYDIGKDISIFINPDDLVEKIKYYLEHESERNSIARSGCQRTITEHTVKERFNYVFSKIGMIARD